MSAGGRSLEGARLEAARGRGGVASPLQTDRKIHTLNEAAQAEAAGQMQPGAHKRVAARPGWRWVDGRQGGRGRCGAHHRRG